MGFFGFSVGCLNRGFLKVSHLLFDDDTLVLCEADKGHIFHMRVHLCMV